MKKESVYFWRVTVIRPGYINPSTVCPIAKDKLQASHRAANMLGISWKENARYMTVTGPIKAQDYQVRQWNEAYPQWSTERDSSRQGTGKAVNL